MSEKKGECGFPNCPNPSAYAVRRSVDAEKNVTFLHLCEEHYNLWKFIDNLLFEAKIDINLRESRFSEGE